MAFANLSKNGLKEVRFLFCTDGIGSKGLRTFIKKSYAEMKLANKDLPLLVRYGKGTEARMLVRYPKLEEKVVSVENMDESQVKDSLLSMLK